MPSTQPLRSFRCSRTASVGLLAALAVASVSGRVQAQDNVLNRFDQPVAGDRFLSVFGPDVGGHLVPRAAMTLDYGYRPFVTRDVEGREVAALSKSQTFLHAGLSLPLWGRVLVSLDMPFALAQRGDSLTVGTRSVLGTSGSGLGELRTGLRLRLVGDRTDPFALSVGGFLYLPTATDAWTGEGYAYGEPQLLVGGRVPHFAYAAFVGSTFRRSEDPSSLTFGAAAAFTAFDGALAVGPELRGSHDWTRVDLAPILPRTNPTSAEARLGVQVRAVGPIVLGAGAGFGIAGGIGTPELRVLARLAYDPQSAAVADAEARQDVDDRDRDGVPDAIDACPLTVGVPSAVRTNNGCPPPPPDRDADGIADAKDACPGEAGPSSVHPSKSGCPLPPPDQDGDGIADAVDTCPSVVGVAPDGCPDSDGDGRKDTVDACPRVPSSRPDGCPDSDGDGVSEPKDACPNERGPESADAMRSGCPKATLGSKEVLLNEPLVFAAGKAVLLPESGAVLDAVAAILKENPDVRLLEIQGHNDDQGSVIRNLKLSLDRATAVRSALASRGVEKPRLTAKGYGSAKRISTEKSDDARARNTRVQLVIRKRDASALQPR